MTHFASRGVSGNLILQFVKRKFYEFIEHTADIGIKIKAKDLKGLFSQTALAMFDIIAEEKSAKTKPQKIKIAQNADNLDELFVNWLNELLSLSAVKDLIFYGFQIDKIDKNSLQAVVSGRNIKDYTLNVEIKAATYHELKIHEAETDWQALVIFDV